MPRGTERNNHHCRKITVFVLPRDIEATLLLQTQRQRQPDRFKEASGLVNLIRELSLTVLTRQILTDDYSTPKIVSFVKCLFRVLPPANRS